MNVDMTLKENQDKFIEQVNILIKAKNEGKSFCNGIWFKIPMSKYAFKKHRIF